MPNSTSISICRYCGSHFCTECSQATEWYEFCSQKCEDASSEEIDREGDACSD